MPATRRENDLGGELVRTSQGARKVQSTGHAMRQSVRLLNRPAYRCRRRCFMPTGRNLLHDALQSHRLPLLAGACSITIEHRALSAWAAAPWNSRHLPLSGRAPIAGGLGRYSSLASFSPQKGQWLKYMLTFSVLRLSAPVFLTVTVCRISAGM